MLMVTPKDLGRLLHQVGQQAFCQALFVRMQQAFGSWQDFEQCPRLAMDHEQDLFELMPVLGPDYYSYKYVNGHRLNVKQHLPTVVGLGMLADKATGLPVLLCEMTVLTAWRTAVVSALASHYLMPKRSSMRVGIIGTGAQSEFQVLAHHWQQAISSVLYYDSDPLAMQKFQHNLAHESFSLQACDDAKSVFDGSDMVITATTVAPGSSIAKASWCRPGMHICAIGGDSPYKNELNKDCLQAAKVVVEYWPQSAKEGEVKLLDKGQVHAELWQLVQGHKPGREHDDELTVFDSVGIALEDYVVLQCIYDMAQQHGVGHSMAWFPEAGDPKDLYAYCARLVGK